MPVFAAACAPADHAVQDTPVTRPSAVEVADARARAILADSVSGDSVALASLPARHREDFDVLQLLSQEALTDSGWSYCQPLSDSTENDVRKRLRARDAHGLAVVLFVRAHRATGAVQRVELVRRQPSGGQRGYIWNEADRTLRALEWETARSQPTEYQIPAGTPAPRALRGLGRRLLATSCSGDPVLVR